MPINSLTQARIHLSVKQAKQLAKIAESLPRTTVALVLEETNLGDAIAVKTNRGTSIVSGSGELHDVEGRGA